MTCTHNRTFAEWCGDCDRQYGIGVREVHPPRAGRES